jgi:hypothetical protein
VVFFSRFRLRRVPRAINNPKKEPDMANKKNTTPGIGERKIKGQVCIASRGKMKKFCMEVFFECKRR